VEGSPQGTQRLAEEEEGDKLSGRRRGRDEGSFSTQRARRTQRKKTEDEEGTKKGNEDGKRRTDEA
jgi:hypothetical protein